MKKKVLKSICATLCIFVFGITSAFALKNINKTYAATSYTITFHSNGGSWSNYPGKENVVKTFTKTEYFSNMDVNRITRSGYKLDGWRVGSASSSTIWNVYVEPKDNGKHLYANWVKDTSQPPQPVVYTITFKLEGGSGSIPAQEVPKGGKVTRPANPTRAGYTFKHWSQSSGGSAYNFNENITDWFFLYAVWEENPTYYKVTFNLNGGTGSINSQTIKEGNRVSQPANPTRAGYTFKYWSTSPSGSAYNFGNFVRNNITLYAIWQKNQSSGGGSSGGGSGSTGGGSSGGSSGGGSSGGSSGGGSGSSGGGYTPPTPTYYKVSFNLNGGSGDIKEQSIKKGEKASQPNNPTKENAIFNGWSASTTCNTMYNFNDSVTKDITLYACYSENYKITVIKSGLPYMSNNIIKKEPNSNLNEYNKEYSIVIINLSTYTTLDLNNCKSTLASNNNSLSDEELTKKCNNIIETLNCTNNDKCYGGKYITLSQNEAKDIIYLRDKNSIKLEYEEYSYQGLYKDKACKNKYTYKNKINQNFNVYECFKLKGTSSGNNNNIVEEPSESNFGKTLTTIVLVILGILVVVAPIYYLIRKNKMANSVD